MRSAFACLLLAASMAAHAAERSYAVLSLMGDRLLIAFYDIGTGSRLDRNARQVVRIPNDSLDRVALLAIGDEVERVQKGAAVSLLAVSDAKLHAAAEEATAQASVEPLLPSLKPLLGGVKATHWIVVTRHRGEARAEMATGTIGSGRFEGLGFYVDRAHQVENLQTGESSTGFLSPFAYLRFSLVEASTGTVVRELVSMRSISAARQSADTAWETLSSEEKESYLRQLIRQAAADIVPRLLAP